MGQSFRSRRDLPVAHNVLDITVKYSVCRPRHISTKQGIGNIVIGQKSYFVSGVIVIVRQHFADTFPCIGLRKPAFVQLNNLPCKETAATADFSASVF